MTSCSPLEDPGRSWDAEAKMVKKTAQNGEVMGYHVNIYEYHFCWGHSRKKPFKLWGYNGYMMVGY